jgi:hypothetical protein
MRERVTGRELSRALADLRVIASVEYACAAKAPRRIVSASRAEDIMRRIDVGYGRVRDLLAPARRED